MRTPGNADAGERSAQQRAPFFVTGEDPLGIGELPPRELPETKLWVYLEDAPLKVRRHRNIDLRDLWADGECLATDSLAAILTRPRGGLGVTRDRKLQHAAVRRWENAAPSRAHEAAGLKIAKTRSAILSEPDGNIDRDCRVGMGEQQVREAGVDRESEAVPHHAGR
jgi:hypothetical protein